MSLVTIMIIVFWLALFLLFWTYIGYLAVLKIVSIFNVKKVIKQDYFPGTSFIITAYNEEKRIAKKIENSLALSCPGDKLEIIVVSDGSTDRTNDIVRSYENESVRLLALPQRKGKHYSQGRGIRLAENDIIVLSDATTFLKNNALEKIVRNFADAEVGCVSGLDRIINAGSGTYGEGAYVRYEMKLRSLESAVNSLVGVSGCFFAVRKHLCENWIDNMSSDFYLPIISYMQGYRAVQDDEAVGYYESLDDPRDEFTRKVRTVVHGLEVLSRFRGILNPVKYGYFSLQMISHKLSRWLVPLYLVLIFVTNIMLLDHGIFFSATMTLQVIFYGLALAAFLVKDLENIFIFKMPLFFVMVNYSIVIAWRDFITSKNFVLWEPTKR
ncbi:MAG: glycosyltransferase family 2 protein [Candidatus Zixiibacteriota bacterium]|nr:MAG: glycosyltransferase family 2 protein [candidate division Zixibacteria bacterium]